MKPSDLTVDHRKLLKLTVSDRVAMTKTQEGLSYLASLTPAQLAELFPAYYKRKLVDVGLIAESEKNRQNQRAMSGYVPAENVPQAQTWSPARPDSSLPPMRLPQPSTRTMPSAPAQAAKPGAQSQQAPQQQQQQQPQAPQSQKQQGQAPQTPTQQQQPTTSQQKTTPKPGRINVSTTDVRAAVKEAAKQNGWTKEGTAALLGMIKYESSYNPYVVGDRGNSFGLFQVANKFGTGPGKESRRDRFVAILKEKTGHQNPLKYIDDVYTGKAKEDPEFTKALISASLEHFAFNDVDPGINTRNVQAALQSNDVAKASEYLAKATRFGEWNNMGVASSNYQKRVQQSIAHLKEFKDEDWKPAATSSQPGDPAQTGKADATPLRPKLEQNTEAKPVQNQYSAIQTPNGFSYPVTGDLAEGNSSNFGHERGRLHAGVDIYSKDPVKGSLRVGDAAPVTSPSSGKIVGIYPNRGRAGDMIVMRDERGLEHRFLHVSPNTAINPATGEPFKAGDTIKAGQHLTNITGSGTAFAAKARELNGDLNATVAYFDKHGWGATAKPHLHYEIRKNGQLVDPGQVFPEMQRRNKNQLMFANENDKAAYLASRGIIPNDQGQMVEQSKGKMVILRGIQNQLDEASAIKYAKLKGYEPEVLDVSGETGRNSAQMKALRDRLAKGDVAGIYGFSGGGYNARRAYQELTPEQRAKIKDVTVIGSPGVSAKDFEGVNATIMPDPKEGHMAGPKVLADQVEMQQRKEAEGRAAEQAAAVARQSPTASIPANPNQTGSAAATPLRPNIPLEQRSITKYEGVGAPPVQAQTVTPAQKAPEPPKPEPNIAGSEMPIPEFEHGGERQAQGDNATVIGEQGTPLFKMNTDKERMTYDPSSNNLKVEPTHRTNTDALMDKKDELQEIRESLANMQSQQQNVPQAPPAPQQQAPMRDQNHWNDMMRTMVESSGNIYETASFHRAVAKSRFIEVGDAVKGGHHSYGASTLKLT
jgi:murein DD-endopeptidase MepM/ murein hydrolase activator NlpD